MTMSRLTLIGGATGIAVALWITLGAKIPLRRDRTLRNEQAARVNLADIATAQLPPKFQPTGPGSNRTSGARGFDAKAFEFFPYNQLVTFRFEADARNNLGGYPEDPILLNVSLWNPSSTPDEIKTIGGTTIALFYPPVDDPARKAAHFAAQQWLPDVNTATSRTRIAATNQGHGDELASGPPARWLVIHVDVVKKVRVDLYAWQSKYSLDAARELAIAVAQSVETTPRIATFFANTATVDRRLADKHAADVATTVAKLAPCGINTLVAGNSTFSTACAAWLSPDQRYIHVAHSLGRVPHPGVKRPNSEVPQFTVSDMPPGKPAALTGPPDFMVVMFYWDAKSSKWSIEELDATMYDDEPKTSGLVSAISARLVDRNSVYVASLARYDLKFHANRVAVAEFLSESQRVASALQSGALIRGVHAAAMTFDR